MTARTSYGRMQALEVHSALAEKGDRTAVRNTVAWWQMALLLCDPGRVLYCYSEMMHIQCQSRQHGQKETLHEQLWSLLLPWAWGRGKTAWTHTNRSAHPESQPCPLRTQWLSRHTVHTHATSPSCLSRTPIHHAPKGSHRPRHQSPSWPRDDPRSPPASHFLRQAWFSYSQEWEDPCGQLFIAGAWGTPNWGSLCFLASIHCSERDMDTTSLWPTPRLPDPPQS